MDPLRLLFAVCFWLAAGWCGAQVARPLPSLASGQGLTGVSYFTENRGQLVDEEGVPLEGVLFRAEMGDAVVYLTAWGLSYFFHRPMAPDCQETGSGIVWERIDMDLLNARICMENVVKRDSSPAYFHYYRPHCPLGVHGVRQYGDLLVREIYPGIDWHIRCNGGAAGFEQDFVVHPGADAAAIQLRYEGSPRLQTCLSPTQLEAACELGGVNEGALVGYSADAPGADPGDESLGG